MANKDLDKILARLVIFALLCCLLSASAFAKVRNFTNAKTTLKQIYLDLGEGAWEDFYCQAPFAPKDNRLEILPSQKYTPRISSKKVQYIEWEHIMPAHRFGSELKCWQDNQSKNSKNLPKNAKSAKTSNSAKSTKTTQSSRKSCQKDALFRQMEGDLHNLVPAIDEINRDRRDFEYAIPPSELEFSQYGACRVYSDFAEAKFYPAEYSRGWIARTYLYMSKKYGIKLTDDEEYIMHLWDRQYPPSKSERVIREAIERKQKWEETMQVLDEAKKLYRKSKNPRNKSYKKTYKNSRKLRNVFR